MAQVGTMEYYRNMDVATLKQEKARELAALREAQRTLGKPGEQGYKDRQAQIAALSGRTVRITQVIYNKTHKAHK